MLRKVAGKRQATAASKHCINSSTSFPKIQTGRRPINPIVSSVVPEHRDEGPSTSHSPQICTTSWDTARQASSDRFYLPDACPSIFRDTVLSPSRGRPYLRRGGCFLRGHSAKITASFAFAMVSRTGRSRRQTRTTASKLACAVPEDCSTTCWSEGSP